MLSLRFTPVLFVLFTVWCTLSSNLRDPSNPPTGRTSAPGEGTCGDSGCHAPAGIYTTGKVLLSGIPDTIAADRTYTLTLTNQSTAVRAGFELTCLDAYNAMCGTLTAPTGSGVNIGGSAKKYARQSTPKTLVNGTTSWTFTWKSPATIPGNKATFYFVSLCANGNGQRTGDNVAISKKEVILNTTSALSAAALPLAVRLYPTLTQDRLYVETQEEVTLTLSNLSGKVVHRQGVRGNAILSLSGFPAGIYMAHIQQGNRVSVQKIIKE